MLQFSPVSMESCACPVSENTRCSCPNLTPCKWKTLPAKLTKHHDDRSWLALLFIALVISCLNFIRGISDYLTAVLDGKSGSSSQRHKRRKCPQNHITLPFFFFFYLLVPTFSMPHSLPLASTACFHLPLFYCYVWFMIFPVYLLHLSFSIICTLSLSPLISLLFFLHCFSALVSCEKIFKYTAALGVCFHISVREMF